MENFNPLIVEGPNGSDFYLDKSEPVLTALAEAIKDDTVSIRFIRTEAQDGYFRVELSDGDEWGDGLTLEEALRYALGAHYAPAVA